jgi:hypothetical protein
MKSRLSIDTDFEFYRAIIARTQNSIADDDIQYEVKSDIWQSMNISNFIYTWRVISNGNILSMQVHVHFIIITIMGIVFTCNSIVSGHRSLVRPTCFPALTITLSSLRTAQPRPDHLSHPQLAPNYFPFPSSLPASTSVPSLQVIDVPSTIPGSPNLSQNPDHNIRPFLTGFSEWKIPHRRTDWIWH